MPYFDYAATTPVDPRVIEIIQASLLTDFGNASSEHYPLGQSAAGVIQQARQQLAALINADPAGIVWTSGATEANNLAVFGISDFYQRRGRHLICAATEHSSVITPMQQLQRRGYQLTLLQPDPDGLIAPDQLSAALRPDTVLVSIQHANNETGVVQPINELAARLQNNAALLHVDAAQSCGKIAVDVVAMNCDLLSVSAHKMYGPKGIGALYLRRKPRLNLTPLLFGGGQQSAMRSGTLPTHQIAGFGKACEIAAQTLSEENSRLWVLYKRLMRSINSDPARPGCLLNGHGDQRLPGIINISAVDSDINLLEKLPEFDLANGAACNSSQPGPSHVLLAMGRNRTAAANALRISFGRFTTSADIDALAGALAGLSKPPGKTG